MCLVEVREGRADSSEGKIRSKVAAMLGCPDLKETTPCGMFGLLQLMESVLQASDLCFLFIQHHHET